MKEIEAQLLLKKYLEGTCSEAETAMLETWYIQQKGAELPEIPEELKDRQLQEVWDNLPIHRRTIRFRTWVATAAAILLLVSTATWFYISRKATANLNTDIANQKDIIPGKNTAKLILADGKVIVLSDAKTGVVIDAARLSYNDGSLIGSEGETSASRPKTYMTAATPRGGTYQVVLPDGSKVWLNAASSLKFPSTFANAADRKVELTGEAYFEVAKDKIHPFIVLAKNQQVKVLGTHFNINTYTDEPEAKTTLLEGSINILNLTSDNSSLLLPNQQAVISGSSLQVKTIDAETAVDWKNGDFIFKDERLESIMRKVARWYNVDVVYENNAPENVVLGGMISRSRNLSAVLRLIESTGKVHFEIQGRKLIVTN